MPGDNIKDGSDVDSTDRRKRVTTDINAIREGGRTVSAGVDG